MAVTSAMVDRMRHIRMEASGERVDGETPQVETRGPWFKCRLYAPTSQERRADESTEYQRELSAIVNVKGINKEAFDFETGDRIQIYSSGFGNEDYELVGFPELVRAKRKAILYKMALRKWSHR